jgi:cyclopropane fatty-acyl-phospholipid synthase-like methyltransferase
MSGNTKGVARAARGTQAIALAERGFKVTATDVSPAAIAYAARKAKAQGADVAFLTDDILATHLTGPYDAVFDRGCFHVIAPEQRDSYVNTIHRLLAPSGSFFLKTFSHHQPGTQGPNRFAPDDIRRCFGGDRFEVKEILESALFGHSVERRLERLSAQPMALSATIHHFQVTLSDVDRNVYETLDLRVARHPSESARYLTTRMLG